MTDEGAKDPLAGGQYIGRVGGKEDMGRRKGRQSDLAERTTKFAEAVIDLAKAVPGRLIARPIILQLVRSATSIGANYCEADGAQSDKDLTHKMSLCRNEANETCYWLRLISRVAPDQKPEARRLWKEAHELHLIFASIVHKLRERQDT